MTEPDHRDDHHRTDDEWSLPGTLGTVAELAYSGFSILQELLQTPMHQMQDWLASDEGPMQALVTEFREQWDRVQQDVGRQLQALDRTRAMLEERIGRGLDELRQEQRSTVKRIERVAIQPADAARTRVASKPARKRTTASGAAKKPASATRATSARAASTKRASTARIGSSAKPSAKRTTALAKKSTSSSRSRPTRRKQS